jgi:acyl-CoA synthetase (AMP-forming)/AMP-acid ligase II
MVHVAPLTHGSGSKLLPFIACAARHVILDRFEPDALPEAVAQAGGTHSFMVPTMLRRLVDHGAVGLAQISFGGSPIAPALFREALSTLGAELVQVYGSTEAPHPVTLLRDVAPDAPDALLASAGWATPAVSVRLVGDDGAPVGAGAIGELQVRSPHLLGGYWNDEPATLEVFTDDGWYRTGDLALMGDDGLVTFQDRKKDLIISGGLNVYPTEVERVLLEHPGVREAVVLGYPDDEWGESVLAYIVSTDGVTADELTEWTRGRLAGYKKPRRYEFLDELPTGTTNKVVRKALRDALWNGRERSVN